MKIVFVKTGETLKTFKTEEKALDWMYENCTITLAWLTGAEEGSAYYKGEEIELI